MVFAVGTTSEIKIVSIKKVLEQILPSMKIEILRLESPSMVPETPWDKETFDGSRNRAVNCKIHAEDADFCLGLESGLVERYGHVYEEAWACIISKDNKEYFGYSSGLKVPDYILGKMKESRLKHWQVMKQLEEENSLSDTDTWGNYSKNMITRKMSLEEALRNDLVQIFAPKESFYHL